MKRLPLIFSLLFFSFSLFAQKTVIIDPSNLDPSKTFPKPDPNQKKYEYTLAQDNEGNALHVINRESEKGVLIKNNDGKWVKHGKYYTYYKGILNTMKTYVYNTKDGTEKVWDTSNGYIVYIKEWDNGFMRIEKWHSNNVIRSVCEYSKDKKKICQGYDKNGNPE